MLPAYRGSGGGVGQRAEVEMADLLGREQGEAPPPRHNAGDIVERIIVGGDFRPIADPDARFRAGWRKAHVDIRGKAGKVMGQIDALDGNSRSFGIIERGPQRSEEHTSELQSLMRIS